MKLKFIIICLMTLQVFTLICQDKKLKILPGSKLLESNKLKPFVAQFELVNVGKATISLKKETKSSFEYKMVINFNGMGTFEDVISFSSKTMKPIKGISPLGPGKESSWKVSKNNIIEEIKTKGETESKVNEHKHDQSVFMGPQVNMLLASLPLKVADEYKIPIHNAFGKDGESVMWLEPKVVENQILKVNDLDFEVVKIDNGLFGTVWISKEAPFLIQWKMSEKGGGTLWKLKSFELINN